MGIFIIITIIALVVAFFVYVVEDEGVVGGILGFIISFIVCSVIPLVIICASYQNYVEARTQYDATVSQYKESVMMYEKAAVINTAKAFTDFKYQGYQENIAGFIKALRREVVRYNKTIISKRVMKRNFFLNWVIIPPDDDMKILRLTTEKKSKKSVVLDFGEIEERPPVAETPRPER